MYLMEDMALDRKTQPNEAISVNTNRLGACFLQSVNQSELLLFWDSLTTLASTDTFTLQGRAWILLEKLSGMLQKDTLVFNFWSFNITKVFILNWTHCLFNPLYLSICGLDKVQALEKMLGHKYYSNHSHK